MMKIIWLTNTILDDSPIVSSGGWVNSMYEYVSKIDGVEIIIMSIGKCKGIIDASNNRCHQYCISSRLVRKNRFDKSFLSLIDKIKPDLFHIWGTESKWSGSIEYMQNCGFICLLEIQGFKHLCTNFWYNGIEKSDYRIMHGLLDLVFPMLSNNFSYKRFRRYSKEEINILRSANFFDTQSDYVRAVVNTYNKHAKIYSTGIILREEFMSSKKWTVPQGSNQICTVTSRASYKGLHTSIMAYSLLKAHYPELKFKIAGVNSFKPFNFGYVNYIRKLARRLGVLDSVEFAGKLSAKEIVNMFDESVCYLNSSFIETYCLSMAEALSYGIPCVVSHSAAMPELAKDGITALTFPMSDYIIAANKVEKIIRDEELARTLSKHAVEHMKTINNPEAIAQNQVAIYSDIIFG